jgi:hypothetical protein
MLGFPEEEWQMRWACLILFLSIYAGGVIGSFEFFKTRFGCAIVKNIDIETCGIATWINAFTWPYIAGRELARWSYEREDERLKSPAVR